MTFYSTAPREQLPAVVDSSSSTENSSSVSFADVVTALTGIALFFLSFFIVTITSRRYGESGIDDISLLGWLAPLLAGVACLVVAIASVALRARSR
ncbi:hypothetical protein [Rathayibacter toxicus]|uniref:Uncharacterized protein n=1 Tax=Rathayibacter toxicus TaxID=145458 RepID=A0A0C5BGC9_9MICO|nr:hypothetical protein [Rathayibacter toxicus]AJM77280.1 hypothetical protein TI83_03510 [Rathayibacter toxicus]ALS56854.1 hypothetical protein APU90_02960 [Rathayibacter toxicus]KKM46305.1 hypothetical protein VT73_04530 [Rathayibacter toxicus]PPG23276.1 hypothetical protein C5D15_03295 [Rathayibacter toxicus]PPG47858.1 hypothetical protein C5D16_03285 [Rathayibacter toxicus]